MYTFEDLCQYLFHEHGLLPDQVRPLTRHYVQTVILGARRDEKGALILSAGRAPTKHVSYADELRAVFKLRGWPSHKIEERVREMLAEQAREKAERERPHREKAPGPRHTGNGRRRR